VDQVGCVFSFRMRQPYPCESSIGALIIHPFAVAVRLHTLAANRGPPRRRRPQPSGTKSCPSCAASSTLILGRTSWPAAL
jgi:hypothetical protein